MTDLVPARMLNEIAYCARLYALEHLNHEWADSVDTVEGRTTHRRVDQPSRDGLPEPDDLDPDRPRSVRSVKLADETLRMIAIIDLVESDGGLVVPVDYKKGSPPDHPKGAWEPERVQVCAQILLLRAHGYTCDHGVLYFAGARRRVRVDPDEELVAATLGYRDVALKLMREPGLPPPLIDSPKCCGCSLVGICLPDEHNHLLGLTDAVRPLVPARDDGVPLYVQLQGGKLGKSKGEIVVEEKGKEVARARFTDTSRVVVYGSAVLTTPLLADLAERHTPLSIHSYGGWYQGTFLPSSGVNVLSRIAQHRVAGDREGSLLVARRMVEAKIRNSRVMLRRNASELPDEALWRMEDAAEQALRAVDVDVLRGHEGNAARVYFEHFPKMLRGPLAARFSFEGRNRRPPRDPTNALLSFAYACLVREVSTIVSGIGLDAWVGFLHTPRPGRPALALDLMEEFRPIIADSSVINAINNEVVSDGDFVHHPTGVALKPEARTRFVRVLERRLDELITHPAFGTRLSYRRVIEVQARLLAKTLLGELPAYPGFRVR